MVRASAHALDRIHDRTMMRMGYVKSRIVEKKTIDIGKEKGTNKHHLIFYSEVDEMCFVIVLDVVDEVIITVLPIDYHNTCSWQVSDEVQQHAKDLLIKKKEYVVPTDQKKRKIQITGFLEDEFKDEIKVNLGKFRIPIDVEADDMFNDDNFVNAIKSKANETIKRNKINATGYKLNWIKIKQLDIKSQVNIHNRGLIYKSLKTLDNK